MKTTLSALINANEPVEATAYPRPAKEGSLAPQNGALESPLPYSWQELLAEADFQGVSGLLYQAATKNPALQIPSEIQEELAARFKHNHLQNWMRNNALLELLGALERAGLDALVIKGAALASWVYTDIGLRPYTDVDLLVRREQLEQVERVLAECGYETAATIVEGFEDNAGQATFFRTRDAAARIDLHWHLFVFEYFCRRIPIEWFWQHTTAIQINGSTVRTLNPLAQLLHLSSHSVLNHRRERLIWSYDLAQLSNCYAQTLDWNLLTETAARFGIAPAVHEGLARAMHWWNAPIPASVLSVLSRAPTDFSARIVLRLATARHREARVLLDGISPSGWKSKVRFGVRHLFPPREYMYRRYRLKNDAQLVWYYPRRVGAVAYKFVRSLWSTARNGNA